MLAVTPPSTGSATPVMKEASGDNKNDTAAANSDASPHRAMGTLLRTTSADVLNADTIEVATDWTRLPQLYTAVVDALNAVPGVVAASAHSSHAYRSGANLYFTLAASPGDPGDYTATYDACWAAAMNAADGLGAGLAHHHGVGRVRRDWMASEVGAGGVSMLRSVKSALDPEGLLNPGVLIP